MLRPPYSEGAAGAATANRQCRGPQALHSHHCCLCYYCYCCYCCCHCCSCCCCCCCCRCCRCCCCYCSPQLRRSLAPLPHFHCRSRRRHFHRRLPRRPPSPPSRPPGHRRVWTGQSDGCRRHRIHLCGLDRATLRDSFDPGPVSVTARSANLASHGSRGMTYSNECADVRRRGRARRPSRIFGPATPSSSGDHGCSATAAGGLPGPCWTNGRNCHDPAHRHHRRRRRRRHDAAGSRRGPGHHSAPVPGGGRHPCSRTAASGAAAKKTAATLTSTGHRGRRRWEASLCPLASWTRALYPRAVAVASNSRGDTAA